MKVVITGHLEDQPPNFGVAMLGAKHPQFGSRHGLKEW